MKKPEEVFSPRQIKQENTQNPHWHKCCITPLCFLFLFLISLLSSHHSRLLLFIFAFLCGMCPSPLQSSLISPPHVFLTIFPLPCTLRPTFLCFFFLQFSLYSVWAAHHYTGGQTVGVSSVHGNMPHP